MSRRRQSRSTGTSPFWGLLGVLWIVGLIGSRVLLSS
jgi:hypothetical protein